MLAKVTGIFRLVRDAELKYSAAGTPVLKLSLACSEKFKDKETQLFIDATAFGKPAEILNQYAGTKGTQIFISGKLQTDSWEKDGQKHYKTSMMIEGFEFIGGNTKQAQKPEIHYERVQAPEQTQIIDYDEDTDTIPF